MSKFTPVDLSGFFNLTVEGLSSSWTPDIAQRLGAMPAGEQAFWGIPFHLAPEGGARWIEVHGGDAVTVPFAGGLAKLNAVMLLSLLNGGGAGAVEPPQPINASPMTKRRSAPIGFFIG